MKPSQKKITATAAVLAVCLLGLGGAGLYDARAQDTESEAPARDLIDVDGRGAYLYSEGEGSPTVVIEVGFGDDSSNWLPLVRQLARSTRVCIYDRAGYGRSEPGALPRSAQQVNSELAALLEAADIKPPYIMVGHSLGGMYSYLFADTYPDLTAGLVLLDPPPLSFLLGERFANLRQMADGMTSDLAGAAAAARRSSDRAQRARADHFETMASEHEMMFSEGARWAGSVKDLNGIPVVVIGSGQANPAFGDSAETFQKFWIGENKKLAARSDRGRFVFAEESTHFIYRDAPGVVVSSVLEVIREVRETK